MKNVLQKIRRSIDTRKLTGKLAKIGVLQKLQRSIDSQRLARTLARLGALQDSPKKLFAVAAGFVFLAFLMLGTLRWLLGDRQALPASEASHSVTIADNTASPEAQPVTNQLTVDTEPLPEVAEDTTTVGDAGALELLDLSADESIADTPTIPLDPPSDAALTDAQGGPHPEPTNAPPPGLTTTKSVSLETTEDPQPIEIIEIDEPQTSLSKSKAAPTPSQGGLEILDLEGAPFPTADPSTGADESSAGPSTANDLDAPTSPTQDANNSLNARKLRRFRRIEATIAKHPQDEEMARKYGLLLTQQGEYDRAERFYLWYLKSHPHNAEAFSGLGRLYAQTRRWQNARKAYQRAAALDPKNEVVRNHLARILATCPDASVRDGALAVKMAKEANALLKWPQPDIADTLAAAFAEAGDFRAAVRVQKWAIRSAPQEERPPMALRLELYRNKQAFHMQ